MKKIKTWKEKKPEEDTTRFGKISHGHGLAEFTANILHSTFYKITVMVTVVGGCLLVPGCSALK